MRLLSLIAAMILLGILPASSDMVTIVVTGVVVDRNHDRMPAGQKVTLSTQASIKKGTPVLPEDLDITSNASIFTFVKKNIDERVGPWYVILEDQGNVACGWPEPLPPDSKAGASKTIRYKTKDLVVQSVVKKRNQQAEAGDILSTYYMVQQVKVLSGAITLSVANDLATKMTAQIVNRTEWDSSRDAALEEMYLKIKASESAAPTLPKLSIFEHDQFRKAADSEKTKDNTDGSNAGVKDPIPPKPKDGADLIQIGPGIYQVGNTDVKGNNPIHKVELSGFYIYKNLVTVEQYEAFVAANPDHTMPIPPYFDLTWKNKKNPIVNVMWDDAVAYCKWAGGRLPTAAEWEVAARGPQDKNFTLENSVYPWGQTFDRANLRCSDDIQIDLKADEKAAVPLGGTRAVGTYRPNGFGLTDMAGNVTQWCSDWYIRENVDTEIANVGMILKDPQGPKKPKPGDPVKVVCGGSWYNISKDEDSYKVFRSSSRNFTGPRFANLITGFRCVIPLPKK